ncbi:GPW/gp25 family protein [Anaerolineales bacterium]
MFHQFVGRRLAFPPKPGNHNQFSLVSDDVAIRQAIYVIIFTVPGERVMRPEFGCQIHELIFDPANEETAILAERYVREAILRWEPRIDIMSLEVDPGDAGRGELMIRIQYLIKGQYEPRSLVYPYYLNPQEEGGA